MPKATYKFGLLAIFVKFIQSFQIRLGGVSLDTLKKGQTKINKFLKIFGCSSISF